MSRANTTSFETNATHREPALSLGVAFQLTNILRDVGEDAVKRGRIYLPREDMERFGVTEEQIFETANGRELYQNDEISD